MNKIFINGKALYKPKGAAREYAAVGCNFYRGCPYQCRYCYNRKGITCNVMGINHAVLKSCFINRPKKYKDIAAEDYALIVFKNEVDKNIEYLMDMGMFFSFSTDPLCETSIGLTMKAMCYATRKGIPVKILTKNATFSKDVKNQFASLEPCQRRLIAIGYSLTGRDDQEPFASSNDKRIGMMRQFHEWGYKTFASIEPIVDFASSYKMVKKTIMFCDQYLIGLMSNRGKEYPPYSKEECRKFINNVMNLAIKREYPPIIYWKESIRELCWFYNGLRESPKRSKWWSSINLSIDYCLQYDSVAFPIRILANKYLPAAVRHLEALTKELPEDEKIIHEKFLYHFFMYFGHEDKIAKCWYNHFLNHEKNHNEFAKKIYIYSKQLVNCYDLHKEWVLKKWKTFKWPRLEGHEVDGELMEWVIILCNWFIELTDKTVNDGCKKCPVIIDPPCQKGKPCCLCNEIDCNSRQQCPETKEKI